MTVITRRREGEMVRKVLVPSPIGRLAAGFIRLRLPR